MRSTHRTATSKPSAQSATAAGPRPPTAPACSGEAAWWDWEALLCGMCAKAEGAVLHTEQGESYSLPVLQAPPLCSEVR